MTDKTFSQPPRIRTRDHRCVLEWKAGSVTTDNESDESFPLLSVPTVTPDDVLTDCCLYLLLLLFMMYLPRRQYDVTARRDNAALQPGRS